MILCDSQWLNDAPVDRNAPIILQYWYTKHEEAGRTQLGHFSILIWLHAQEYFRSDFSSSSTYRAQKRLSFSFWIWFTKITLLGDCPDKEAS